MFSTSFSWSLNSLTSCLLPLPLSSSYPPLSPSLSLSLKQPLPRLPPLLSPMFEFGDDLTIEGYRVSWLIWIQVLVLLLLIFLLFCFSFFPADLPDTITTSSSASPSALGVFTPLNSHLDNQIRRHNDHVSNRLQHSQVYTQSLLSFLCFGL